MANTDLIQTFARKYSYYNEALTEAAQARIDGNHERCLQRGSVCDMYALDCLRMCSELGIDAENFDPVMVDCANSRIKELDRHAREGHARGAVA